MKNKKNLLLKSSLYFRKRNFSAPRLENVLYFRRNIQSLKVKQEAILYSRSYTNLSLYPLLFSYFFSALLHHRYFAEFWIYLTSWTEGKYLHISKWNNITNNYKNILKPTSLLERHSIKGVFYAEHPRIECLHYNYYITYSCVTLKNG